MAELDTVVYRIDPRDIITFVNPEWDRFAAENASPEAASDRILSRSLWDFIADETTRHLYRDMLKGVRTGRRLRFPFRCDSPDCRRFLELDARHLDDGAVEFQVRTLALEPRAPQPILDGGVKRREPYLRMCGWCKKVPDGDGWVEIEEAVAKMKLFDEGALPAVSHGICEGCDQKMRRTVAA